MIVKMETLTMIHDQLETINMQLDSLLSHREAIELPKMVTLRDVFPDESAECLQFMGMVVAQQAKKLKIKKMWQEHPYRGKVSVYEYSTLLQIIKSIMESQ